MKNTDGLPNFKVCPKCKDEKTLSEYHVYFCKSRKKYRIANYCKTCSRKVSKEANKVRYQNDKATCLKRAKEHYQKNRLRYNEAAKKRKQAYREQLQGCYVRQVLAHRGDMPTPVANELPEAVEAKRLQIKIIRRLKKLKNGNKK